MRFTPQRRRERRAEIKKLCELRVFAVNILIRKVMKRGHCTAETPRALSKRVLDKKYSELYVLCVSVVKKYSDIHRRGAEVAERKFKKLCELRASVVNILS